MPDFGKNLSASSFLQSPEYLHYLQYQQPQKITSMTHQHVGLMLQYPHSTVSITDKADCVKTGSHSEYKNPGLLENLLSLWTTKNVELQFDDYRCTGPATTLSQLAQMGAWEVKEQTGRRFNTYTYEEMRAAQARVDYNQRSKKDYSVEQFSEYVEIVCNFGLYTGKRIKAYPSKKKGWYIPGFFLNDRYDKLDDIAAMYCSSSMM